MNEYKTFIYELCKECGIIIRDSLTFGISREIKIDGTPVTEIDTKINKIVITKIKERFPSHNVLGEEESSFNGVSEYTWICDPIDGTIPFTLGIPTCVFSLSLCKKGEIIEASIYDPFTDRFFYASKSAGAFLNDSKLKVSSTSDINKSILGIPYRQGFTYEIAEGLKLIYVSDAKVINLFSILYMGALVAAGSLDAVIFAKDTEYDAASLKLLIEEAGGKVTDLFGEDQRYDKPTRGIIVSNGIIHSKLVELLKDSYLNK
jgi:fructose-1,6-bisphosphatase/inositol monophosphatase family enzyme